MPLVAGGLFLVWQVWLSVGQIATWRSNLTLWSHAARSAPLKPRVVQNFGLSLIGAGQVQAGVTQLYLAVDVAQRPHVPIWDRLITERLAGKNLQVLSWGQ